MNKKRCGAFLVFCFCIVLFIRSSSAGNFVSEKTKLAGVCTFPTGRFAEWGQAQSNPTSAVRTQEKIFSSVLTAIKRGSA
jgi:hypothetical protein